MTLKRMEQIILKNLLKNEPYTREVLPYLKSDYFQDKSEKVIFDEIQKHLNQYNVIPSFEVLNVGICGIHDLTEIDVVDADKLLDVLKIDASPEENVNELWLMNATEKFCQESALHNAIRESIQILDPSSKSKKDKGSIPQLLNDALSISFNPQIGHDYIEDADERFDYYHIVQRKFPFKLEFLNKVTKGGLSPKTLTVFIAGTNVGKSLAMCDCAAGFLLEELNVLYITLEMAKEKIAERIDANLFDVAINDIALMSKEAFDKKIEKIKAAVKSKLVIEEYPTAAAGTNHFKALLHELNLKKKFKPDIIFVDYINICTSARMRHGNGVNSYTLVKSIAEELRGMGVEHDAAIVTATQTNRSGYTSSDVGAEDTSESFGVPMTADLMIAIMTSEELEQLNQLSFKVIKNRDNDVTLNRRFVVGVDRKKMRLYDVEDDQQTLVNNSVLGSGPKPIDTGSSFDKYDRLFK